MKYLIYSIIVLSLALTFLAYSFFKLNNKRTQDQILFSSSTELLNQEIEKLHNNDINAHTFNHIAIDDFIINNIVGGNCSLQSLANEFILVIRKTEFGCSDCFGQVINALNQSEIKTFDKVFIILSSNSLKDARYYINNFDIKSKGVFYTKKSTLPEALEESNQNYCFILSPNLIVSNLFIPDINNNYSLKEYFNSISRLFNNNNQK